MAVAENDGDRIRSVLVMGVAIEIRGGRRWWFGGFGEGLRYREDDGGSDLDHGRREKTEAESQMALKSGFWVPGFTDAKQNQYRGSRWALVEDKLRWKCQPKIFSASPFLIRETHTVSSFHFCRVLASPCASNNCSAMLVLSGSQGVDDGRWR
ncbi:hypothetical protein VIGAN_04020000 [Vigna angularis var. angularis]|uniref:Uncharacterized protein n=1 Tax=Vigna angularis var. angularis TaxID=157739 RepID=A0A0S3RRA1_PHAAN|nr:hypothetical protein VIGAN_04020000 [Vigna angularis var. angularis]